MHDSRPVRKHELENHTRAKNEKVNEKRGNQIDAGASARCESFPSRSRLMKRIQTREGRTRKSRTDKRITWIPYTLVPFLPDLTVFGLP